MEREYRDDRSGLEKEAHTHTVGEWKEVSIFLNEKMKKNVCIPATGFDPATSGL